MSRLPSVSSTPISLFPSTRSIARIPLGQGRENSIKDVFLTVPFAVAINTNLSLS